MSSDLDFAGSVVANGVVTAMVSEFQLIGLAAECESAKLVSETDAENGDSADHFANSPDGVVNRFRIAGAIGEKHAIGFQRHHVGCRRLCGDDGDVAAFARQHAKNVLL